ncbi:MAG TPA: glycosyltransferase family 2 protein [Candidatus Saccharimonadales bacterium]|nr:glycosyltransferase family 2 protein [Candidatus Saccharimonadales bacterium]
MTTFFENLFNRYPVKTRRSLEILPGFLAWMLILSPLWGSLFIPTQLAYFILFFDVYWLYKSFSLVFTATIASKRIKAAENEDWNKKAQALPHVKDVHHVLIILNYKETVEKIRKTLDVLALQTFPPKQLHIVLAMEERETEAKERGDILIKQYKSVFGSIFATYHPDVPGEVKGKSSNEAFAGRVAYKKLFEDGPLDPNYATISSVDADSIFDRQYFAYLSYKFLTDSKRYNKFWQSAIVFHNNIWEVPAPTRITSFFGNLYRMALLTQGDRLLTHATYSLSIKLIKDVDFWDVDVIPEDYRIFFKAFYNKKGNIWVDPIYLKTSMDAAQSSTYISSLKNKYHQERRWSWGVSDNPLFIKWWLTVPDVPFFRKTVLMLNVLLDHILWPSYWFIVTIAANVMAFINPVYSRTSLGFSLPQLAGSILSIALAALLAMLFIDYKNRPTNKHLPLYRKIIFPFEFLMMPFVGFFLSALPALISHTQLMFGKRLEYKVTDKV